MPCCAVLFATGRTACVLELARLAGVGVRVLDLPHVDPPRDLMAAGVVGRAVDHVLRRGGSDNAFCCIRPPGHHAGRRGRTAGSYRFYDEKSTFDEDSCYLTRN